MFLINKLTGKTLQNNDILIFDQIIIRPQERIVIELPLKRINTQDKLFFNIEQKLALDGIIIGWNNLLLAESMENLKFLLININIDSQFDLNSPMRIFGSRNNVNLRRGMKLGEILKLN